MKSMKCRALVKLLKAARYTPSEGKGDHEKWTLGAELVVITETTEISPGLVCKALDSIERSKGAEK